MDCYLILISVGSLASLLSMILLGIIRLIVGDLYHVHVYCCHIINYFTLHIICLQLKIFGKYLHRNSRGFFLIRVYRSSICLLFDYKSYEMLLTVQLKMLFGWRFPDMYCSRRKKIKVTCW